MAESGDTQQRYDTLKKTQLEILSIERELRNLGQERLQSQAEFLKGNDRLRTAFEQNLKLQEEQANAQKSIEQQMRTALEAINTQTDTVQVQLAKSAYDDLENRMMLNQLDMKKHKLLYEQIKQEMDLEQEKFKLQEAQYDKLVGFLGKFGELFNVQKKYNTGLKMFPKLTAGMRSYFAGVLTLIEFSVKAFFQFDDALAKFRMTMGMMRTDSVRIRDAMKEVAIEMTNVGVTIEGAVDATMALADEFGGTAKISKDLVETTAILKAQLGVVEQTSAGFLRNISALGKSTAQAQQHMVYVAQALSSAAGVPLNMVMQDVAKMSGNALAMVSKMPLAIVKTAVAARQMGTTLNKMADASANILNFTESVQAEMEASVLVGEQVNLQLARELAYRGKIVDSTKAILSEANRINFEKLDYFQMQAFATASGRSVDELMKMIQAQKQLQAARGIDGLKDEVAEYERLNAMSEADLNNKGKQAELAIRQMANQARLTALTQQWNQLLLQTTAFLFPVFDILLKIAIGVVKLGSAFAPLYSFVKSITTAFLEWGTVATKIADISVWIKNLSNQILIATGAVSRFGAFFGKIFSGIGRALSVFKFFAPFAKAIPVIGWIITGLTFVYSLVKRIMAGEGIGSALKGAIYDTILKPFMDAWNWIKGIFVGNSPSTLALGIVRGIIAVEAMIFDALTSPFRRFLAWVADKIPGMGGIAEKLRKGMTGNLEDIGVLEKKAAKPETKPLAVTTEGTPLPATTVQTVSSPEEQKRKDQDSVTLGEMLKSIRELNNNLMSGKIGIYIDGQLMSATLARQTAFKGGYGMNMA